MGPKLDMGKAWSEAVALMSANRDVMLIVAGVFFFVPALASALLVPEPAGLADIPAGTEPDMAVVMRVFSEWAASYWWAFVLSGLMQTAGVLGLLALLTDNTRPTVGEALGFALKALPTYIATQLIIGLLLGSLAGIVLLLGAAGLVSFAALVGIVLAVGSIYVSIKLILVTPVIGIEKQLNPLTALRRSWRLTKGNSLLILAFVALLVVAFLVISMVASLLLALFAMAGDEVGFIVGAVGNSAIGMLLVIVMTSVLAAIHRQLSGRSGQGLGQTFD